MLRRAAAVAHAGGVRGVRGLIVGVCAFLALLIIPIASQVDHLRTAAPAYIDDLRHNATINDLNTRYHLVAKAQEAAKAAPNKAFGALSKLVSGVVATITVLFLTLFLMLELPALSEGVLRFLPDGAGRARAPRGRRHQPQRGRLRGRQPDHLDHRRHRRRHLALDPGRALRAARWRC